MSPSESNIILFTGAGFTANWGGFLNNELWSQIFNHKRIQKNKKLKKLLQEYFKFEYVLEIVQSNPSYSTEDKKDIWTAVNFAFDKMESIIMERAEQGPYLPRVKSFIDDLFIKRGVFFTVNQDLFVERYLSGWVESPPGISSKTGWPNPNSSVYMLGMPTADMINDDGDRHYTNLHTSKIAYIKLHGSHNWYSQSGSHVRVIGGGKEDKIKGKPILALYFRFFKDFLSKKDNKMLIIGYGFRDEHINKALGDAVKYHNLRMHVICPEDPESFRNNLLVNFGSEIWEGITTYYPYDLNKFLSSNKYKKDLLASIHLD